ncbi:MAG TPA: hypothetical protein VNA25_30010 [Phycisphaerae bacterium]|nr:hypothetical protein [Phycisphaerae bacterium]
MNANDLPYVKCLRCGETWQRRVKRPAKCPLCGSRDWDKPPVEKVQRECLRCGHRWGGKPAKPLRCPVCHSVVWDKPKAPRRFSAPDE